MDKEYEVVTKPAMHLVGVCIETDYENGKEEIQLLWERFLREGHDLKIRRKKSKNIFILYSDYDKSYKGSYQCLIGCEVKHLRKISDGMVGKTLPARKYARFVASPKNVAEGWRKAKESNLQRTYLGDFEVYSHTFRKEIPDVEIFVTVE